MQLPAFYSTPFFESLSDMKEDALLFSDGISHVKAGEVKNKSIQLAKGLREKGFSDDDRAVLIVPPGKEFLEIFFAMNLLKGKIAIIDPEMGRDNFESKLKQFAPKWIFIDSRLLLLREHPIIRFFYLRFSEHPFYISLPGNCNVIATGKKLPLVSKVLRLHKLYTADNEHTLKEIPPHEFVVTYTSGTLAEPKGVVHSMRSLYQSITQIKNIVGNEPGTKIAAYLPHFLLIGLCSGNPVFLFDKGSAAQWRIDFFNKNKITTLFGPPSDFLPLIDHCRQRKEKFPSSLKLIILGSAPVHTNFLSQLYEVLQEPAKVLCLYGMTENLLVSSIDGKEKMNSKEKGDVVGKLLPGVEISIAEDHELLVNSPWLFDRYLHLDKKEMPHATGDLGYFSADGTLALTGRKKDMIIRRDTNIYPAIYEKTIRDIPGVKEAVLVGIYSETKHDEEVILVVEGENISAGELMKQLVKGKYSIDKEALPDEIVFMSVPKSGRQNKVDRKKLREVLTK